MLEGMTERVQDPEKEMEGWELGGRTDRPLPNDEDDEVVDDSGLDGF